MFDKRAFGSWPLIVVGAAAFAMLFMLMGMMAERLFEASWRLTANAASMGLVAFVGYIAISAWLRQEEPDHPE